MSTTPNPEPLPKAMSARSPDRNTTPFLGDRKMTLRTPVGRGRSRHVWGRAVAAFAVLVVASSFGGATASAADYVPISGAGSTWSQNAIDQWRRNVNQYGLRINYAGTGSSDGRTAASG